LKTGKNNSNDIEFSIIGFSDFPYLRIHLSFFFLLIYILTLIGNLVLLSLISLSPKLNTPMYYFLGNLSFLDILFTSVTAPKLIHIFAVNNGRTPLWECITQLYFIIGFGSTESFLLTLMSYDRYIAVCKPLHYTAIMNHNVCIAGAIGSWLGGLMTSFPIATSAAHDNYCGSNIINHFFCDIMALLKLACNDITVTCTILFVEIILTLMTCFLLTVISYICILWSILKIHTSEGKYKAFSTCSSHLTVVSIFYVIIFALYLKPKSEISLNQGRVLTLLNVYFIPMFNPIIYSLRNKEVRGAFK
ncbi:hypothetical protein GDO86_006720, partial [Hymenochirus boettgeri]